MTVSKSQRPLSPHLQIYKPQISSLLSILHRLTGLYLSLGSYVLVLWLLFLAFYPQAFLGMYNFFGSFFGKICLISWTLTFFYHLFNGVRHLFWDAGKGYDLKTMECSGWAVLGASGALTVAVWLCVFLRWGF